MVVSSYFYRLLFVLILLPLSMSLTLSGKLEVPQAEIKCGACPCFNPCDVKPPPPPPPSPPQPTPVAPPPPRFVFVTGYPGMTNSPGSLYQSDPQNTWSFYSGVGQNGAETAIFAGSVVLLFMVLGLY